MNPKLGFYEFYKHVFPDEWEYKKLNNKILDILSGFAFSSSNFSSEKGVPLIRVRDVDKNTTKIMYDGYYDNKYIIRKNDLIIGMDGNYTISKWKGNDALLNQRVCRIKTLDETKLFDEYLNYVIRYPIEKIEFLTPQTTVKHLSTNDIRNIMIPIPPLVEQHGIAEVLGTIDDAIRLTNKVIERTEALKRGLMQRLLTQGIGHTEFKDTPLGKIPKAWKITTIDSISNLVTDGVHQTPDYITEGVPFISATNFENGAINWDSAKYISKHQHEKLIKRCRPEKGDVLLSKVGTLGLSYVIIENFEFSIFVQLALIKPKNDLINNIFLKYILDSHELQKNIEINSSGSTLRYIGINKIKKLKIPLPPRKEQDKIAENISLLDCGLQENNNYKNELLELKKGLMQILLSGKIRVELRKDGLHRGGDCREANN